MTPWSWKIASPSMFHRERGPCVRLECWSRRVASSHDWGPVAPSRMPKTSGEANASCSVVSGCSSVNFCLISKDDPLLISISGSVDWLPSGYDSIDVMILIMGVSYKSSDMISLLMEWYFDTICWLWMHQKWMASCKLKGSMEPVYICLHMANIWHWNYPEVGMPYMQHMGIDNEWFLVAMMNGHGQV